MDLIEYRVRGGPQWTKLLHTPPEVRGFRAVSIFVEMMVFKRGASSDLSEFVGRVFLYFAILLYTTFEIWVAATPGKLLLGLRIGSIDGSKADPWRRTLRWSTKQMPLIFGALFAITSFNPFYLLAGLTELLIIIGCLYASNDDHLAWHDQWAGPSVVYRTRRSPRGFPIAPLPLPHPSEKTIAAESKA